MHSLLRDIYDHQEWADAAHWRAFEAWPAAREHLGLRRRLHHIHQVQRMFVWAIGDRAARPTPTNPDGFRAFEDLKAYARGSHEQIRQMLSGLTAEQLAVAITGRADPHWSGVPERGPARYNEARLTPAGQTLIGGFS